MFVAAVVLLIVWFSWQYTRPEHAFNAINRFQLEFLKCEGGLAACPVSTSMVPSVFNVGDPRGEVLRRLEEAGYHHWVENRYIHRGGIARGVCSYSFFVEVAFDDRELLTDALALRGIPTCP